MVREVFKQKFTNASAITAATSASAQFIGSLYVEMSDFDEEDKGPCNVMNVHNGSDQDALIVFDMSYRGVVDSFTNAYPIAARAFKNIKLEDGKSFTKFRIVNRNTTTNIATGSIFGEMARVV